MTQLIYFSHIFSILLQSQSFVWEPNVFVYIISIPFHSLSLRISACIVDKDNARHDAREYEPEPNDISTEIDDGLMPIYQQISSRPYIKFIRSAYVIAVRWVWTLKSGWKYRNNNNNNANRKHQTTTTNSCYSAGLFSNCVCWLTATHVYSVYTGDSCQCIGRRMHEFDVSIIATYV